MRVVLISLLLFLFFLPPCSGLVVIFNDDSVHKIQIYKSGQLIYTDYAIKIATIDIPPDNYLLVIDDGNYIMRISPLDEYVVIAFPVITTSEIYLLIGLIIFLVCMFVILFKK